jgi:ABC-type nitrate/sulfonate/bicarbonate transport system substrate-binding protein
MKKNLIIPIFIICCFWGCKNNDIEKVSFAAFDLYMSGLVVAATEIPNEQNQQNCMEKEELNYTLFKPAKGPDMVNALMSGSADFGTLANTPIAFQALQGDTFVIFATIMTTNKDIKVLGHKKFGINSGADLKGKKVGYVGGTIGEIFLDRYLGKYNLSKEDISLISAGPAQLRDYFLTDELDAIILWEPAVQDIMRDESLDKNEIFIEVDTTLYTTRMHLVATPEKLKKYRKEATKLIEALICGENRMYENPEEARLKIEEWLGREKNNLINVFDKNSFKLTLNVPVLLNELEEETLWAQDAVFDGKGSIPDNYMQFIDYSILDSIAPRRVLK